MLVTYPIPETRLIRPLHISLLVLLTAVAALPAFANANLTAVDDTDQLSLEQSASEAFYRYLSAIDEQEIALAYEQVLEPSTEMDSEYVLERLVAFSRGRRINPVSNESLVIRPSGDWALVVYQYDTTVGGKTARVITTAWMVQWEGYWRQYVVEPSMSNFWEGRRADYERLQRWFDEHAAQLSAS